MLSHISIAALLAFPIGFQFSLASPLAERSWSKSELATFDNIKNPTPLTSLTEINVYDDLDYDGFVLITLGVGGIVAAGITAKSGSNVAAFAANTALLYGNPTLKTTGTSTKSFDLDYFYFGCVLATEETALSTPTACTVDIAGYDSKGKKAKSQSFHFKPTGAVKSNMVQAKVTGWTQLSKVTFSNAANLTEATLLDNFSYTVRG